MTNYRFVFGSTNDKSPVLCGQTIRDDNKESAIAKAQQIVDAGKLDSSTYNEVGDIVAGSTIAHDVVLYFGDDLVVTSEHIEDEWDDNDE